ncbi:CHAT domain-containing protein [Actinocrispum wychmicini]|uniref:CHAT domain-containing protein n=1 Tax=Actinocrispum wychmicini TaxID=1213861 RepID=A0A4R2K5U1_9PSEU|nr:CHAT domain-containing protein [Actinocrispum wychmicini]TCO65168.1 CHAT domain-containing protein [Actinocrispum wychmicini]
MSHHTALAHVERGDFVSAHKVLRANDSGDAWLTAAWVALERGNTRGCARALAKAAERGAPAARVRCLHGLRLCATGSYPLAVVTLSQAAQDLGSDPRWLANALVGKGIALGYLLRLAEADASFAAAQEILVGLGEDERAATCVHNRGFVALQGGDVPLALALFDKASDGLRKGRAEALVDRASALATAGMIRDATAVLDEAERLLVGRASRLAEVAVATGYCALWAGDLRSAAREAQRAQDLFRRQRRPAWVAVADALALRIELAARQGRECVELFAAVRRVWRRCLKWGRLVEAAELLVASGNPEFLRIVAAQRRAPVPRLRALRWLARARVATDNRRLFAACRAGMRASPEFTDEFVATALRAARRPRDILGWLEPGVDLAAFGARAFVRFAVHDGELLACSVVRQRIQVHRLGPDGTAEVNAFRLRLKAGRHDGEALDRRLFGTLELGDRELVIVPAKGMSGLVWAALPTCAGRPVSVVPSAAAWVAASRVGPGVGTVSVTGPELVHASREVTMLGHDTQESTVDSALAAMEGVDVAHVAAHGRFRLDAPLFSSLQLADGELYVHDLRQLTRTPRILVLSACEVARAEAVAKIVLERGTQALIASTLPVPDEQAVDLVTTFHRRLRLGDSPAHALAEAQRAHGHLGFSCFGAG